MSEDVIKLHDLRPAPGSNKAKTRVGRGEGSKGKTAGRGTKGTGARKNVRAGFEGGQMPIHMRLPKLKGFKKYNQVVYEVVNVADLEKYFPQGGTITIKDLQDRRIVKKRRPVKVLGDGELSVKFDITANKFSKSAKEKIEAAGGSTTEVYFSKADKTGRSLKEAAKAESED
ncbi:50S ribosomal protein L15 [Corynebacterium glucuronolyticum]|uniref:Large ribosomal subunit protein uL15 n=2 Tax=Corynebacterium glucuronolyticum TaxID=39791 RepID=A0AAX1L9G8_9CORY|nr:50S ribosomal protein L15 [Corynebacterium glucuronolyticum]EEI63423.1 ribosomal protein L15 [Corynebacterium glucuronolyticum ATCC 51866]QRP71103.1 50S ribosomal protein L15 [Corynebacterium glucuronolyticum]